MTVLVTGGTGFVGVNLIRALAADGVRVRALVRPTSSRLGLDIDGVEFVEGDVTDLASLERAAKGCEQAYHVAGWVQITPWGAEQAHRVNVLGAEKVCKACMTVGVGRLVHTSSIAAVGYGSLEKPATEEMAWNLGRLRVPYYTTKHEGEAVVRGFVERGLDAVIVNPSYVVGPFDIKPSGGRMMIQIATGRLPGFPTVGGIGFVDVREVVEGMRLAMERGERGERYILNGENISYRDYARRVARLAGVAAPKIAAPYWLLYPAALAAGMLGRLRTGVFTDFNPAVLKTAFCGHYVSGEKSRGKLGLMPRSVDSAIVDALKWFEENDYIRRDASGKWVLGVSFRR